MNKEDILMECNNIQIVINIDKEMFENKFGDALEKMNSEQVSEVLTECIKEYFTQDKYKNVEKIIFDTNNTCYGERKINTNFTRDIIDKCDMSKMQNIVDKAIEELEKDYRSVLVKVLSEALIDGLTDEYAFKTKLSNTISTMIYQTMNK